MRNEWRTITRGDLGPIVTGKTPSTSRADYFGGRDIPGFCKAETAEGIGKHGFVLTSGRYAGAEEQEDDGEPFAGKDLRLLAELEECFGESERLMGVVRERLGGLHND